VITTVPHKDWGQCFNSNLVGYDESEVSPAMPLRWESVQASLPHPDQVGKVHVAELASGGVCQYLLDLSLALKPKEA
jgi:hypothetical protein